MTRGAIMKTEDQEEGVRRVYGEIAGVYEAFFPSLHRYEGRVERFLGETVTPGCRVLDVGCGPGQLTRELAPTVQRHLRALRLDLSPRVLVSLQPRPPFEHREEQSPPGVQRLGQVAQRPRQVLAEVEAPHRQPHVEAAELLRHGLPVAVHAVLTRGSALSRLFEHLRREIQAHDLNFWSFEETARALGAANLLPRRYAHAPGWVRLTEQRTMSFGWWDVERR